MSSMSLIMVSRIWLFFSISSHERRSASRSGPHASRDNLRERVIDVSGCAQLVVHHGKKVGFELGFLSQLGVQPCQLVALALQQVVGFLQVARAHLHLRFQMAVHAAQLTRHVVEPAEEVVHLLGGATFGERRAQPPRTHLAERAAEDAQRTQHEQRRGNIDNGADDHREQKEERDIAHHVVAQRLLLLVDGDDDADGAAHAALLPAFLLETGDIHLAFRRAVAFQAALVHFERF